MTVPAHNKVILLAEDNSDDVLLIRLALEKAGSPALLKVVRDGEEALDYLQGEWAYADREQFPLPGLLLLDLAMPRMSGLEVLAWLQPRAEWMHLPVVVLSGFCDEAAIRRAYELGAVAFLVKPAEFGELVTTMKHVTDFWLHGASPEAEHRWAA
jgi:CheY-like chemotaxis protein